MTECNIQGERGPFRCTGYDGRDVWEKIHGALESIPCETCREHAVPLGEGLHDHVNVGLGKEPHDERTYLNFVDEVVQVHNEYCSQTGRCKIK